MLPAVGSGVRDHEVAVLPEWLPEWVRWHIGLLPGVRSVLFRRQWRRLLPRIDAGVLWGNVLRQPLLLPGLQSRLL